MHRVKKRTEALLFKSTFAIRGRERSSYFDSLVMVLTIKKVIKLTKKNYTFDFTTPGLFTPLFSSSELFISEVLLNKHSKINNYQTKTPLNEVKSSGERAFYKNF